MVGEMQELARGVRRRGLRPLGLRERAARGRPEPGGRARSRSSSEQGHTYRSEGALWLRTTDFGDDKDRVLVRSNGEHTYFASDIAYHQDKRERGFERQIDVWGADHHGYVLRMKAAYEALGGDPEQLELLIMQLVHLMRGGERAQMSKRAGEFVTLDELRGGDRRGRRPLVPARALARHDGRPRPRPRARAVEREPRLLRPVRPRPHRLDARARREPSAASQAALRGRRGALDAASRLHPAERALIEQLLAFPGEVRGGGRAARPPPDRGLRAGARPGLHRLLPRLPRARRRARDGRVAAASRCRVATQAHDRPLPGSARGERARARCRRECGSAPRGAALSRSGRGRRRGGRASAGLERAARSRRRPACGARAAAPAGQQHGEQRASSASTTASGTR